MNDAIQRSLYDSAACHLILAENGHAAALGRIAKALYTALDAGRSVFICGNGGSAADAQHVAAEFIGRFKRERQPYPVMALSTDTSVLTAVGNDYGYTDVFARQVRAWARRGDVVVGISTSGESLNVAQALVAAARREAVTIGFTGRGPSSVGSGCDHVFEAPEQDTARVQELHIAAWHAVIGAVEAQLCAPAA